MKLLNDEAKGATTEEEIPYALRNRPVLNQFQAVYFNAYNELAGSRQYTSAGSAEIPYSEKINWLDENEIFDPDERRDYLQMVSVLDGIYLEDQFKKSQRS